MDGGWGLNRFVGRILNRLWWTAERFPLTALSNVKVSNTRRGLTDECRRFSRLIKTRNYWFDIKQISRFMAVWRCWSSVIEWNILLLFIGVYFNLLLVISSHLFCERDNISQVCMGRKEGCYCGAAVRRWSTSYIQVSGLIPKNSNYPWWNA